MSNMQWLAVLAVLIMIAPEMCSKVRVICAELEKDDN